MKCIDNRSEGFRVVFRNDARYHEERIQRTTFNGVFNNVAIQTKRLDLLNQGESITDMNNLIEVGIVFVSDCKNETETYGLQNFRLSPAWEALELNRGDIIEFRATLWRLTKLKGKNAQLPGALTLYEFRYPSDMKKLGKDKTRCVARQKLKAIDFRNRCLLLQEEIEAQLSEMEEDRDYERLAITRQAIR